MKYIQGDIVLGFKNGDFDAIAHQCNCFGIGAGIALTLDNEFAIKSSFEIIHPSKRFGTYTIKKTKYGDIINLFSQFNAGGCDDIGIDSFDVRSAALKHILKRVNVEYQGKKIGIPLIASGIAADRYYKKSFNLNDLGYFQRFIGPIIENTLIDVYVTVVYL